MFFVINLILIQGNDAFTGSPELIPASSRKGQRISKSSFLSFFLFIKNAVPGGEKEKRKYKQLRKFRFLKKFAKQSVLF